MRIPLALLALAAASQDRPPAAPARTRPLAIAHRGFSWEAPENTLAAYRMAIEIGVEMAECDVRLSRDGIVVLSHDEDLKRTAGVTARINELTLEELKKLDVGKWKSPRYEGERIPTLAETLDVVKGKIRLVIEIKEQRIEERVLQVIRDRGVAPESLMVFSFHHDVVKKIAELEPLLPTTWLLSEFPDTPEKRTPVIRQALRARVSAIAHARKHPVDPAFLRQAHECGLQMFVWTVNDAGEMRRLNEAGIDGIISDRPDVLLKALQRP